MRNRLLAMTAALCLAAMPAIPQEWHGFGVERFGFVFDVPPGFLLTQRSDNGDGASFEGQDGAFLAVWGMWLDRSDFRAEIEARMKEDEAAGWDLTYKRVTAKWASYSGLKDGRIRYVRGIVVCGDRAAMFLMDYARADKEAYDPVVTKMVRSLKGDGC